MRKPDTSTIARAKRRKAKQDRRAKRTMRPCAKRRQRIRRETASLFDEAKTAYYIREVTQRQQNLAWGT